jgi:hypothetical protein
MSTLVRALDRDGNPPSALLENLAGRRVRLSYPNDEPHPLAAHATHIRHLAVALTTFLDAFDKAVAATMDGRPEGNTQNAIVEHFRQVVYRMTETMDFYAGTLPDALGDKGSRSLRGPGRDYRAAIKRRRDHWALICNRLKHNTNVLVPVTVKYLPFGPTVVGFGVCSFQRDVLAPNRQVHPNKKALGYPAELHQLASDVLHADVLAGTLCRAAEEEPTMPLAPGAPAGTLPLGAAFARIACLTPIGMGEKRTQEVIELGAHSMSVGRRFLRLPSYSGEAQVSFPGDGITNSFEIFG